MPGASESTFSIHPPEGLHSHRKRQSRCRRPATPSASSFVGGFGGKSDTLEARAKLTSDSALELGGLPRLPAPRALQEGQRRSQV